jgi:hypothetical protein
MNTALIAQLEQELARLRREAEGIETALNALRPVKVSAPKVNGARPATGSKKAPPGALEDAMDKAIRAKPGLTNGEVRSALAKAGYAYSLTPLHVGKRLSAMVAEKRLSMKLDGNKRRYHPTK